MFGVLVLALVTAFGGGLLRNLFIGLPVSSIWSQAALFNAAFVATAIIIRHTSGSLDPPVAAVGSMCLTRWDCRHCHSRRFVPRLR